MQLLEAASLRTHFPGLSPDPSFCLDDWEPYLSTPDPACSGHLAPDCGLPVPEGANKKDGEGLWTRRNGFKLLELTSFQSPCQGQEYLPRS